MSENTANKTIGQYSMLVAHGGEGGQGSSELL